MSHLHHPIAAAFVRFAARPGAMAGAAVLVLMLFAAVAASGAAGGSMRALAATPSTLQPAFVATLLAGVFGILWGAIGILTGGVEAGRRLMVLPLPLVAAAAPLLFGGGETTLVAAAALACSPTVAVPAHDALRAVMRRDFVVAARAAGMREGRIFVCRLLPNVAGPLLTAVWRALPPALLTVVLSGMIGGGPSYLGETWGSLMIGRSMMAKLASAGLLMVVLASLIAIGRGLVAAAGGRAGR